MTIIGIDASTTHTGYGVFINKELVDYGCIEPVGKSWRDRLVNEGPEISALFNKYKPDKIYMENVPLFGRQMETLVILGAVQGFIIGIAASMNIPIEFLMPSEWRRDMGLFDGTRSGMQKYAMKEKAVAMVNELFGLELRWLKPKSLKNQDDVAEGILIGYSQIIKS